VIGDSVPSVIQSGDTLYSSVQAASYQWYQDDTVLIVGATADYFVPMQSGNFSVATSRANGCTTQSTSYNFLLTLIGSSDETIAVGISPNPFNHILLVHATRKKTEPVIIILRDAVGKIISKKIYHPSATTFDETLDFSFLAAGVYLLNFETGGAQKTFKVMKYE
jgi:hypothetical protein